MPAKKRRFEPAVIELLFKEPYRFEYFQAVRLLELWLERHAPPRQGKRADLLRFQNPTSLAFPASEVAAIDVEPRGLARDASSLGAALQAATLEYVRITPAFMGLLGGNGVLPMHYTERIASHQQHQADAGPRAFLDAFSHRSLALFYAAWRKYRLALAYRPGGADGFLPLLLSLAGLGHASLRRRFAATADGALLDESIGHLAAALRHRPASAAQLARVLAAYFGQPVVAEQFIGHWYEVPPAQQSVLGGANAVLGAGAMAGVRVWQRDLRLRLVVGPLDGARFDAFLPGGLAARAMNNLLSLFTGMTLEYDVELVLLGRAVRATVLDGGRAGSGAGARADGHLATHAGRLGWDAYLVTQAQQDDRRDVRYTLRAA
ncbi:type VI secretion system baseplate subunit TssG [uncultured Massilia sp.]|uniref:type VI secretion system baseplate subunit TssG n=1 Tax=uncultured Massilia sp. TaxID=169973 RepID=UPI0025E40B79|nr:type VI secretion system baseplate subunit TssG [uncultured Massilia sp.]